jgi:transcriptional regulator with XRE-family HTH domain
MINLRIKEIRRAKGLTQVQFANALGIKQSSLSDIESGKTESIDERNIRIICKEFNVSENWLRNGEGEMFLPDDDLIKFFGNAVTGSDFDDTDKKIITEYLKLSPKQRKIMKEFIKKLF